MHTKLLIRPIQFNSRYQQWKQLSKDDCLNSLRNAYSKELCGQNTLDISVEKTSQFCTLMWYPKNISAENLSFLLDYFRDVLLNNNYYNHLSEEKTEIMDRGLKHQIQSHFLKPDISFKEQITPEQHYLFGHIYLELNHSNQIEFKIKCSYFSHKTFWSIEKLMELLLQ